MRDTHRPPLPGLVLLMLVLGGLGEGSPTAARFWLLLVALLCAGLLWWGLEALQERHQVRRHVRVLRSLRAFADRLSLGSLASTGFYRDGSLELTGRWRDVPVRLQARQHPPTLRLEVWTDAGAGYDVERTWRGSRGLEAVPTGALGLAHALLREQRVDWIATSPTGVTAATRLDDRTVDPAWLEGCFGRLLDLAIHSRELPSPRALRATRRRGASRCPYCHAGLRDGTPTRACGRCGTDYHDDCYRAGGCAVLGCAGRWRSLPLGAARA